MIPERNLMAACGLNGEQKRIWVATITEMMKDGPKLIFRLPKIRLSRAHDVVQREET
ncbi:hypothetical protein DPMN_027986 [Dreissena polymorpha]|uniref:Uncharacterized protein n=1 Tax=Dreissena polymorpha TaxID=45954 RepID=A0A9D4LUJ8_DREPO|nr:hypothetical protein DPMN_027986 [Dreissena polymorpha]